MMERETFIARFKAGLDVSDERVASVTVRRYSPRLCAPGRVLFVHGALHTHALLPEMQNAWQDFCQALRAQIAA